MGMDISVLGVDLGKNVCRVVGLDASGAVVVRRKVRRETLIALAAIDELRVETARPTNAIFDGSTLRGSDETPDAASDRGEPYEGEPMGDVYSPPPDRRSRLVPARQNMR
jgi:hypothetical protein